MGKHTNQHYISRAFITRFSIDGKPNNFHKYLVTSDRWQKAGPKNTFCHNGYTQLIEDGQLDNSLELVFGKVETNLGPMFAALDEVANLGTKSIPEALYDNMCWYFAFLHCLSPYFKAAATRNFYEDLNEQLEIGQGDLLERLTPSQIAFGQAELKKGNKIVIDSDPDTAAQFLFRVQFIRHCKTLASRFRFHTQWTVCRSSIDFPISDIAIMPIPFKDFTTYSLPISPNLYMVGELPSILNTKSAATTIERAEMPPEASENWLDLICQSAQICLVSKVVIPDVFQRRERAKSKHLLNNIKHPGKVIAHGKISFKTDSPLKSASKDEYDKIISQFTEK